METPPYNLLKWLSGPHSSSPSSPRISGYMSLQALVFGFQNLPSPRASLTLWVLVQEPWLEQDGFW